MNLTQHGVIWDMDGTLVDTADLHFAAWQRLLGEHGLSFDRHQFAQTFGRRNPEIIALLFKDRPFPEGLTDLGPRKEALFRAAAGERQVPLLPGAAGLLAGLHEAGAMQAIGSSAPRANIELLLMRAAALQWFKALVSMEDTSKGKPHPEVFLLAAERLGLPPASCLVVEDAPAGVQAAKAAGMACLGVASAGQHPKEALAAAGADLAVHSLEDVTLADLGRLLGRGS